MKVRISYTVDVSDAIRRAIRHRRGEPGLATRIEVRDWYRSYGDSMDLDILMDLDADSDEAQ
jgi:hypothetical protein